MAVAVADAMGDVRGEGSAAWKASPMKNGKLFWKVYAKGAERGFVLHLSSLPPWLHLSALRGILFGGAFVYRWTEPIFSMGTGAAQQRWLSRIEVKQGAMQQHNGTQTTRRAESSTARQLSPGLQSASGSAKAECGSTGHACSHAPTARVLLTPTPTRYTFTQRRAQSAGGASRAPGWTCRRTCRPWPGSRRQ